MGQPRPLLSLIFVLVKQTSLQFLQQIYVEKCPSSIRCRDSNPRPLEHESPPITTRPGLPPSFIYSYNLIKWLCDIGPMPNGSRHKFDLCLFDLKFHVCLFVCLFVYLASTHMSRDEDNKTILRKLLPFYSCSFLPFCTFAHLLSLSFCSSKWANPGFFVRVFWSFQNVTI